MQTRLLKSSHDHHMILAESKTADLIESSCRERPIGSPKAPLQTPQENRPSFPMKKRSGTTTTTGYQNGSVDECVHYSMMVPYQNLIYVTIHTIV